MVRVIDESFPQWAYVCDCPLGCKLGNNVSRVVKFHKTRVVLYQNKVMKKMYYDIYFIGIYNCKCLIVVFSVVNWFSLEFFVFLLIISKRKFIYDKF